VISGFIISAVVSKPNYDVRSFAIRRVFRIFPLWWLVMSVGLAMYFWRSWFRADVELLGWVGVLKSYALLPQKPYPFINPGWSLEYEVIFYAIVALLYPLTGIWGVFVLMLGLSTAANAFKPADGYHLVDGSYLFFGAGIVAYLLRNRSWREAAPLAAGGLALAYARFYEAIPIGQRGHGGARHWVCGTAGSRCFA
jgi:peptidoglycan/LPS O-acetylase OafA/YrhL